MKRDPSPSLQFFSDNQAAVALGLTLRSLHNKIHRHKAGQAQRLPEHIMATARGRVWSKEAIRRHLNMEWNNAEFVDLRMALAESTEPLGTGGANTEDLKIHRERVGPKVPKRPVGRPRKTATAKF